MESGKHGSMMALAEGSEPDSTGFGRGANVVLVSVQDFRRLANAIVFAFQGLSHKAILNGVAIWLSAAVLILICIGESDSD
jgi:hypothetical protein